ncbi:MAG: chromosome segregation protein SMC, partial [Caulobacteraceae bacterium]
TAGEEARAALARVTPLMATLEREIATAPDRLPALATTAEAAETARALAEAGVEALAARSAAAEAVARGAKARVAEVEARLARASRALSQARNYRAALAAPPMAEPNADPVAVAGLLDAARAALDIAEASRTEAARGEDNARAAARAAADQVGALHAEARGLASLLAAPEAGPWAPVLQSLFPAEGLEAALAAALGDDAGAALDPRAPAYWRTPDGEPRTPPSWPAGAEPLAPLVRAPPQIAARLAFTAVVARQDGPRFQVALPPGARLVSRQGDLWRWDGLIVGAEAPRPARAALEHKARLARLEVERAAGIREAGRLDALHAAAAAHLRRLDAEIVSARGRVRASEAALVKAREAAAVAERAGARIDARRQSLDETVARFAAEEVEAAEAAAGARTQVATLVADETLPGRLARARATAAAARETAAAARLALDAERRSAEDRIRRLAAAREEAAGWSRRAEAAASRGAALATEEKANRAAAAAAAEAPGRIDGLRMTLLDRLAAAEAGVSAAMDALAAAETARADADRAARTADSAAAEARETRAALAARLEGARERVAEHAQALTEATGLTPGDLGVQLAETAVAAPPQASGAESHLAALEHERDAIGPVNLRAEEEAAELAERLRTMAAERGDLSAGLSRLRAAIGELNAEGRERLLGAFAVVDGHFRALFTTLFQGGEAQLRLVESDDPLEAGLEILACPPGKRMAVMSLMSGGEQALTAIALIFAVFLANPAPICVLDEVDAPLDDANIERFCALLTEMRRRAPTRFVAITHNPLTMSRMDRLFGVTMPERGISQLVSVDLRAAETLAAS